MANSFVSYTLSSWLFFQVVGIFLDKWDEQASLAEYRQAFALFDANKDGFITIDELEKAMKRFGKRISRLELSLIMHHADNDREYSSSAFMLHSRPCELEK